MMAPQNVLEVWNLYQLHIETKNDSIQAKRICNETQSAIMRILLGGLGHLRQSAGKKMTRAEVAAAQSFMETLEIETLRRGRAAVEEGFSLLDLSEGSRNTYGGRLEQFLAWCENQYWWKRPTAIAVFAADGSADHCPSLRRGYGKAGRNRLTDRRSIYRTYKIQPEDITPHLEAELKEFYSFLTAPDRSDRRGSSVTSSTANIYLNHICLMLGWFRLRGTPRKHLSLSLLIPVLSKEILEELTPEQREICWNYRKLYVDTWICKYFGFLRNDGKSKSPETKRFKTLALTALGKFQYRTEVRSNSSYARIPVLKTIKKHSDSVRAEVAIWKRRKNRVVSIDKKWPRIVENQTALTTIRKQVVEELRSFCKPKYESNWHLRSGSAIASSLRDYIAWNRMTDMPARRQEEARSWRISLTCPIKKPTSIPYNGFIHPLPPEQIRERDDDNLVSDNYLYKTYVRKGKFYPEGVWVLDIHKYKTQKKYGSQSIIVRNRQFADGSCLYDYIERYLYGWWKSEENTDSSTSSSLYPYSSEQGQWVSAGRAEFQPQSYSCSTSQDSLEHWKWGYFFVTPRTGAPYSDSRFKEFFSTAAHKVSGKRITPHIIRDMWATWAYQVGLTDAQRESLAYAMGMDLKTLEECYERCSPDEKRRPIEEVIDQVLFGELEVEYQESTFYLNKLAEELLDLPEADRLYYAQILSNT